MAFLFYAGSGLDRAGHLRRDAAWLEARLGDPRTRLFPLWKSLHVVVQESVPRPLVLEIDAGRSLLERAGELVFLGERAGIAHFAVDLSPIAEAEVRAHTGADLGDLRFFGSL